jgi:hypothetical protein
MRSWKLAQVVDKPTQHIVGLGHGHRKGSGRFLGHDDPGLQLVDHTKRRDDNEDPEKRKQGQSV